MPFTMGTIPITSNEIIKHVAFGDTDGSITQILLEQSLICILWDTLLSIPFQILLIKIKIN